MVLEGIVRAVAAGGPFALHLALDASVEVVEEVVAGGLVRGRLALDGAGDVGVVGALDGARAAFAGDLLFELLDDEVGGLAVLGGDLLVQRGDALLLDTEGFGRAIVEVLVGTFVGGPQPLPPLPRGKGTSISAM